MMSIHSFILLCLFYQRVYGAITSLSQTTKPNAGQPVPLLCEATNGPSVPGQNALTLTGSDGLEVTASETTVVATDRRVTTFIVTVVDLGTEFTCSLLDSDGTTVLDQQTIIVDIYVLPFLQSPPTFYLDFTKRTELTINWLSWETNGRGDGPILHYEVVYRNMSDVEGDASYDFKLRLDSNQTTTARVTGLRTEHEYDFAVVVVREGEGGAGMPSNKTTITTLCAGVPTSVPIVVSLTAIGPTELQLVWRFPPPSTWGCQKTPSILMNFKESSENFGFPVAIESADPPGIFNISNLLSCSTYDVQMYYFTSTGYSNGSEVISGSTPRTVPPRVILFWLGNAEDGVGLFARWSPPEGAAKRCHNGTYYVHYTLLRLEACGTDVLSPTNIKGIFDDSTSTTLDNLIPYATYNVSVVSSNELGYSTDSPSMAWTTISTFATVLPPVQVTNVTARSFVFSWERIPCEDLHGDFTAYRYIVTNNKTGEQTSSYVNNIDVTMKMLQYRTPCSPYDIQMTLYNDRGEGDRSENVRVTTDTEMAQVVLNVVASSVDENPSELDLIWDEPLSSWCPIEYYRVSYELVNKYNCETVDPAVRIVAGNATQLSYTIMNLLPFSTYFVFVEAYTKGAGFGMPGRDVHDTAERAPTVPPNRVEVGGVFRRELSFSCGYPDCTIAGRSSRILGFTYNLTDLVKPDNPSIVIEGESSYQAFDGLVPNTRYSLRVRLRTNAGDGPYSEPIEATTLEDKPGPPSNVTLNEIEETTMTVTWEVPLEPNGNITFYQVQYRATEKPYNPSFRSPSSLVVLPLFGPSVMSNTLTQLEPSTKYEIFVSAQTLVGRGGHASVEAFTKPKTDIPKPAPPTVDTSTSTATTVAISLPNEDDTYITSYLIAVKKTSNKRAAVDIDGELFGTYNDNPNAYIAAEITKRDKADSFVVGDGVMYGDYLNAPLVMGTTYSIRTGSASKTDTASTVSWSEPLVAEARSYGGPKPPATTGPNPDITDPPPMAGDNNVGIIAAVVLVVILLIAVAGFAVLFYLKRKRIAQEPADTVGQTQMKEREVAI